MTVGIICEYNPFHNGHLFHINKIREEFGPDTSIVALMSGNYTQRGETAIADKGLRAKCAVIEGVNLVLELPFPYSMSSAEFFAASAVNIFNELGCIDVLSFGSECGNIDSIFNVAGLMLTDEYRNAFSRISTDENTQKLGYPVICQLALEQISNKNIKIDFTPNNILAIEYVKAIIRTCSSIKPHTIKREANDFSDISFVNGSIQSAASIRNAVLEKDITALNYIPDLSKKEYLSAINNGEFPCDVNKLSSSIIMFFRINSPDASELYHDAKGGLYNRLKDQSFNTNNLEDLVRSSETKKYTRARIKRAIFNSLLGVTSSQLAEIPRYTQLLAADFKGRQILKTIKSNTDFMVLTKPSDTNKLSAPARAQKALSDKADSVFQITKPIPKNGNDCLRFTPFIKK